MQDFMTKKVITSDRADFDERVFPGLSTRLPEPPAFPTLSDDDPTQFDEAGDDDGEADHKVIQQDIGSVGRRETRQQVGDDEEEGNGGNNADDADTSSSSSGSSSPRSESPPLRAVSPPAPIPAPDPTPAVPTRHSTRTRVPAQVWQNRWYRAGYNRADHRVPPQPPQPPQPEYRDPPPQIPSDEDSDSHSDASSHSDPPSEESELVACEVAYLTMREGLEEAYKVGTHNDEPRTYVQAMRHPQAQKYHDAACEEIQSLLDNGTWELAMLLFEAFNRKLCPILCDVASVWLRLAKRHCKASLEASGVP